MNFHEARNEMTIAHQKNIEKVIEKYKRQPNYYILVITHVDNYDPNVIREVFKPTFKRPEVQLGTILYYVDNRNGELFREWVLPRDIIQPEETINKAGDFSDEIFSCGEAPNR